MFAFKQTVLGLSPSQSIIRLPGNSVIIVLISLIAWITTLIVMADMDEGPGTPLHDFGTYLVGWVLMLTAMMLPSELQYIHVFLSITGQRPKGTGHNTGRFGYAAVFMLGYALAWTLYGVLAFLLDQLLRAFNVDWLAWEQGGHIASGLVLLAAAAYQLSSWKNSCLTHCRSPLVFFTRHWRAGHAGALYLGARHGAVCVLCCWALMAVMFAVGAMNLIWMGILTLLMFAEKVFSFGYRLTVPIALLLGVVGVWLLISPDTVPYLTSPLSSQHAHHHH